MPHKLDRTIPNCKCYRCGLPIFRMPCYLKKVDKTFCSEQCQRGSVEQRFYQKINKTDGCWYWTGSLNHCGYGTFNCRDKTWLAHRLSYQWSVGSIPDGYSVLHKCDNPKCVRPDHLFLGTQADNVVDMMAKGRCRSRKLVESEVLEIRRRMASKEHRGRIAREFGVSYALLFAIANKKLWKHI